MIPCVLELVGWLLGGEEYCYSQPTNSNTHSIITTKIIQLLTFNLCKTWFVTQKQTAATFIHFLLSFIDCKILVI
jgi:hypothetical protein